MLRRLLILLAVALVAIAPASAGTIVVRLSLVAGQLEVRSAAATATSAGPVQVPVTLADGRGNGKGWTLKVSSSRAVSITSITVRCAANSTCTLPTEAAGPSGARVLQAAAGTGMGVMNLVVTVAALPSGSDPAALSFSAS